MATSFGYVKRDVQDMQINWAEVGQNVRNVLDEESRIRQEKKDAIDKATREYEQRVTDSNLLGEDVEFNKGVLQFSADAQEMILMQDMLLKSGQLKPSDYTIMRQNMVDGTNEVFKTIELFNNERDAVMQGVDNLELSLDNLENFALVQEASNFNKNRIVFDPYSGKVNVANMVEDPNNPGGPLVPDNNPNTLRSVQSLSNIIRDKVARFDVIASAEEYSKKLAPAVAETIKSMGGTYTKGTIEKITSYFIEKGGGFTPTEEEAKKLIEELGLDPKMSTDAIVNIHRAINQMGESIVSNDRQGMSILIDFAKIAEGGDYITTFNEADTVDANGNRLENVILKRQENGRIIYELTDAQKKEAKKQWTTQVASFLEENTEVRVQDIIGKPPAPPKPSAAEEAAKRADNDAIEAQKLWNELWGASPEEKKNILTAFLSRAAKLDDGLVAINPTADGLGLDIEYLDTAKNTRIEFTDDISKEEWAKLGTELTGLEDPEKQLAAGGFADTSLLGKDAEGQSNWGEAKAYRAGSTGFESDFKDALQTSFDNVSDAFLKKTGPDVIDELKKIFPEGEDLGIRFLDNSGVVEDEVIVSVDGFNETFKLDADFTFERNAKVELKRFIDWVTNALQAAGKASAMDDFINNNLSTSGTENVPPPPRTPRNPNPTATGGAGTINGSQYNTK
jgi:hypothetical protein